MIFETSVCAETVTILEAILLGAGQACIDLGPVSLLSAVGAFMLCVVAMSFLGGKLLRKMFPSLNKMSAKTGKPRNDQGAGDAYESPIKSTGAWGRGPR